MRYLILSDLHANWEALEPSSRDAAGALRPGPLLRRPGRLRRRPQPRRAIGCAPTAPSVVRGNHDRACTGQDDLEWFNPVARARRPLDPARPLARKRRLHPRSAAAARCRRRLPAGARLAFRRRRICARRRRGRARPSATWNRRVAFFGHTHVQGGFIWNHSRVETIPRTSAAAATASPGDRSRLRLPDQPRLGRPAARRRPARGLRHLRFRGERSDLPPRASTTWPRRRRRSATPGCRRSSPTAFPWAGKPHVSTLVLTLRPICLTMLDKWLKQTLLASLNSWC